MDAKKLSTPFGTATLCNDGYYRITTKKEGNNGKKLCRLIYEDHHNVKLSSDFAIHHIDKNKANDSIENLIALPQSEHRRHHMLGENNPNYGKPSNRKGVKLSAQTREKIRSNHADVSKENNPMWGTSIVDKMGGFAFLKDMKLKFKTLKKVEDETGVTTSAIVCYLRRRGLKWSNFIEAIGDV